MTIKVYNKLEDLLIQDIYEFSILMEDKDNPRPLVFAFIHESLQNKLGKLIIGYIDNKKIGFGYLAKGGPSNPKFQRLKYLAIKKEYRNNGYGTQLLQTIINQEIDLNSGCELACKPTLSKFYETLNFTYKQNTDDNNESVLILCNNIENRKRINEFYDLTFNEQIIEYLLKWEVKYNIKLLPR